MHLLSPPRVMLHFSAQAAGHDESVPHSSSKLVLTVVCLRKLMSSLEKRPFLLSSFLFCFFYPHSKETTPDTLATTTDGLPEKCCALIAKVEHPQAVHVPDFVFILFLLFV